MPITFNIFNKMKIYKLWNISFKSKIQYYNQRLNISPNIYYIPINTVFLSKQIKDTIKIYDQFDLLNN